MVLDVSCDLYGTNACLGFKDEFVPTLTHLHWTPRQGDLNVLPCRLLVCTTSGEMFSNSGQSAAYDRERETNEKCYNCHSLLAGENVQTLAPHHHPVARKTEMTESWTAEISGGLQKAPEFSAESQRSVQAYKETVAGEREQVEQSPGTHIGIQRVFCVLTNRNERAV